MTMSLDWNALARIGLGDAVLDQLDQGVADDAARLMRVAQVERGQLLLHDGHDVLRAALPKRLVQELAAQGEALTVGDWVLATPASGHAWHVRWRLQPARQLWRRRLGQQARSQAAGVQRQALVSHVDTALIVMGLDHDFNLRRLERYLAWLRLAQVPAVLVLSKADTLAPVELARHLDAARACLRPDEVCVALDGRQAAAATTLAPWLLPRRTLVVVGSSGAGKSTLVNSLLAAVDPVDVRATGPVRGHDHRGQHTTTQRTLLPLPGGACIIDTPGLRALRLDAPTPEQLADVFQEVARWAPACRFANCQHRQEPDCAVRRAVPEATLLNFHKLLGEASLDGADALARRAQLSARRLQGRAGFLRASVKRGMTP